MNMLVYETICNFANKYYGENNEYTRSWDAELLTAEIISELREYFKIELQIEL